MLDRRHMLAAGYLETNLVSDQAGAALIQDPNLVNPWGIALSSTGGAFSVSDNGTSVSTHYAGDVSGSPFTKVPLVTNIPGGAPTGEVFNATSDFVITGLGGSSGPATFIFATQTGEILGWNSAVPLPVPSDVAQLAATVTGADFTGLAIGQNTSGDNQLYAADFQNGQIDVFGANFNLLTSAAGAFTDPNLPAGYAPFNIQNIGGKLYVTYAQQQAGGDDGGPVPGKTGGIVDVYDTDGNLVNRFSADTHLNAPWGLAQAPANFGQFSGDILVGDFGDGRVNAFKSDGTFDGQLSDVGGAAISIDGLRGLSFGNGVSAGNANTLFFTSDPGAENVAPEKTSVLLLDPSSQGALSAVGNGTVKVTGGGEVVVDSNNSAAVTAIGNGEIAAPEFDITGVPGTSITGNGVILGRVDSGVTPLADPLASLPVPSVPSQTFPGLHASGQDDLTLQPGAYTGDIMVTGQATLTLQPGVYYVEGGLSVTGNGQVLGQGVTIYLASSSGGIALHGQGSIVLTAPDSGTYKGIAIFQARDDSAAMVMDGNGNLSVTGVLYAPAAQVKLTGNGHLVVLDDVPAAVSAQLIALDLEADGNGDFELYTAATATAVERGLFGSLDVAGPTPIMVTSVDLTPTEGAQFTGAVAAFASTAVGATASDFSATIDWGDGTTSSGTVTAGVNGGFLVDGSHTYAEEGTENVTVTISDNNGNTATATDTATVADAALTAAGVTINASTSATFNGTVAAFTDADPAGTAADYTAMIDWGDGTTASPDITPGTIVAQGGGFAVIGAHLYSSTSSRLPVTVTIADSGGATATANSTVVLAVPVPTAIPDTFVLGPGGAVSVSGSLSVLANDISADGQQLKLMATVVATTTHGTLTLNANGTFTYAPNSTFQGIDRFSYQVSENGVVGNTVTDTLLSYNASLVDKLYHQVLHRSAEDSGLIGWTAGLNQGTSLDQIAQDIFNSPERLNPLVNGFYEQYLNRPAEAAGLASWVGVWQQTGDPGQVQQGILASQEFYDDAGDTVDGFVRLLYQRVLDRQPDSGGLMNWDNALNSGQLTRQQAAAGFLNSAEFHIDTVDFLFGEYFGNPNPTPTQAQPYVTDFNNGDTRTQVELAMINSTQYSDTPPEPASGAVGIALFPH